MLAEGEDVDVEVRWEDQKRINEFGRNNARLAEAQEDLQRMEEKANHLDDANTELMMADGDDGVM